MKQLLAFFFVFVFTSSSFSQPCDICIHGVSIISPQKDIPLEPNKDVFIQGEKIIRIADALPSVSKESKTVIDGAGKFLMPGLSDMHVHLPSENLNKFLLLNLDAGVTSIRSMRGKYSHVALKKELASGERLGPDLYIASPYFPNKQVKQENLPDTIKAYKVAGFDCVKVLAVPDSAYYEALIKAANEIKMPVAGHWPWQVPVGRVIESGYACIEHLQGLHDEYLKDPALIPPLVEKMKKLHTYNCASLDYYDIYYSQVPLEELQKRPGLSLIDTAIIGEWTKFVRDNFAKLHAGSGDSVIRKNQKARDYMQSKFKLVKMLADLGAPMIMSGAQANDPFGVPGFCLWEEMKLFVKAGIPIKDVLKMATFNTAEFFHETDSCGCIEAGRKANLVLLDKNPLESLDNLASREAIFIHGKYFTPNELEARMVN
jgi:hypothetical protein